MSNSKLGVIKVSNLKVWAMIGVGIAGVLIIAETQRRRKKALLIRSEEFGAFVERFELLPFPQPPPPAARQCLFGLTFAIKDLFDVKDHVTGFGNPDWKTTHEAAEKTAVAVTALLKNGATCVGKTVMDELAFGITGENKFYGTPINPVMGSHIPGGSSSGSAVAVAAELVDFALGTDTGGCIRVPAAACGILGFRPSHGTISMIGVQPNSQSLDTVGWFARDPSILYHVGQALLQMKQGTHKRSRRFIFAEDLFQLSKFPQHKTVHVVSKVIENFFWYDSPKNLNFCQCVARDVPSLKGFLDDAANPKRGVSMLKALSSVMLLLQSYEFKTNHQEWVKTAKPKFGPGISQRVHAAISLNYDNIKSFYKVRAEMRSAIHSILKNDGILVLPTIADYPFKLKSNKGPATEFNDRAYALSSIASMSGCCQVSVPLGTHDGHPVSVSFLACHGEDKFLLDTVVDIYSSLQEQASIVSKLSPLPNTNGNTDPAEVLKEKGNAAFKERQWNKAVTYYSEAINLTSTNATYFCNRAAALLELACYKQAEEDCSKAISLDKKNVKAYLRRGTARESLLHYKDAMEDFNHALVLEPKNKVASQAAKRLKKLIG